MTVNVDAGVRVGHLNIERPVPSSDAATNSGGGSAQHGLGKSPHEDIEVFTVFETSRQLSEH
jgi:hypothetical protein